MTLNDFLKRVDIERDKDKMLLHSDGIGWSNVEIQINDCDIIISPCKENSSFSSDK